MSPSWKKIERVGTEAYPYWLEDDDACYYAREFISGGGYAASETNNLVTNFKKPPARKGLPEWKHKGIAIRRFATEIAIIGNIADFLVTCIPPSVIRSDPNYDSRLEDTLRILKELKPTVVIEFPLSIDQNLPPAHLGGRRNPDEYYQHLEWSPIASPATDIIVIDDVITSGAHFKACKRMIKDHIPDANVVGLFWARTVWSSES